MNERTLILLFSILSTLVNDFDVTDEELESFITDEQADKFDLQAKAMFPMEDRPVQVKNKLIEMAKEYLAQL